jgi:hypothetical protein
MRRREFIRLFSSIVVAWPLAAQAQQRPMPVLGYLGSPVEIPQNKNASVSRPSKPQAVDAACEKQQASGVRARYTSEHPPNKVHGFSTDPVVVFAFRSVLNRTVGAFASR